MQTFPEKNWVMVGDSGQMDPVVYATLYKQLMGIVDGAREVSKIDASKDVHGIPLPPTSSRQPPCIYIRMVKGFDAEAEKNLNCAGRFMKDLAGVNPEHWMVFSDPKELEGIDPTKSCYPPGKKNEMPAKASIERLQSTFKHTQPMVQSMWLPLSSSLGVTYS